MKKLKEKLSLIKCEPSVTKLTMEIHPSIYSYDFSGIVDPVEITNNILDYKNKNQQSNKTYVNAWHSFWYLHKETNKFNNIISIVENKITQILKVEGGSTGIEAKVAQCWAIIYGKDNFTNRHKHFDLGFSAVYYSHVEKNPSPLMFDNNISIVPKANMLVCFPGYVYHSVPKMTEDEHRICLAFNLNCNVSDKNL